MPNIGAAVGNFLGFDPTPGFNLANGGNGMPYLAASNTRNSLGSKTGNAASSLLFPNAGVGAQGNTNTAAAPSGTATVRADPYAAYGGEAAYNQKVSDLNGQRNATFGSIDNRIGSEGAGYNSSILDLLDSQRSGQGKIDAQAVQNELAKRNGTAGVLDMVGQGVRSGGVMLANKNAGNSSGAEGIARAYADLGRRAQTQVGNQYETGNVAIQASQTDLDNQLAQGQRHLEENKATIVNSIVSDAQNALSALNASAASASLPDRVDIEGKKAEIRNKALAQLQQFDSKLSTGKATASSRDANEAKAAQLAAAGTAPENAFQFTTEAPLQAQGGPMASDLPLFTIPTNKKQLA